MGGALAIAFVITGGSRVWAQANPQVPEATQPESEVPPPEGEPEGSGSETGEQGQAGTPNAQRIDPGQGIGFAISEDGRARVHLNLDMGGGFNTNPYATPYQTLINDFTTFSGDIVTTIRPNVSFEYPGSLIAADGEAWMNYGFLPGVIQPRTRNFALFSAGVGAGLEVNRGGMFSFAVRDELGYYNRPGFVTPGTLFSYVQNRLQAGIGFKPGGGTLKISGTANFNIQKYFSYADLIPGGTGNTPIGWVLGQGSSINVGDLDNLSFGARARVDWRFLPKTGLFADAGTGFHFYYLNIFENPLSFPTSIRGGVMGQITSKISGLAAIGYTNPITYQFATTGVTPDLAGFDSALLVGIMGQVEAQWAITPSTNLAGGLMRRVTPAPLYQHVTNNRAYINFRQTLFESFVLEANGGYSVLMFGRDLTGTTTPAPLIPIPGFSLTLAQSNRLDGHLDANLFVGYYLWGWLGFGVSNQLDWRLTNGFLIDQDTGNTTNLSFLRNETLGLLSIHY